MEGGKDGFKKLKHQKIMDENVAIELSMRIGLYLIF